MVDEKSSLPLLTVSTNTTARLEFVVVALCEVGQSDLFSDVDHPYHRLILVYYSMPIPGVHRMCKGYTVDTSLEKSEKLLIHAIFLHHNKNIMELRPLELK